MGAQFDGLRPGSGFDEVEEGREEDGGKECGEHLAERHCQNGLKVEEGGLVKGSIRFDDCSTRSTQKAAIRKGDGENASLPVHAQRETKKRKEREEREKRKKAEGGESEPRVEVGKEETLSRPSWALYWCVFGDGPCRRAPCRRLGFVVVSITEQLSPFVLVPRKPTAFDPISMDAELSPRGVRA